MQQCQNIWLGQGIATNLYSICISNLHEVALKREICQKCRSVLTNPMLVENFPYYSNKVSHITDMTYMQ